VKKGEEWDPNQYGKSKPAAAAAPKYGSAAGAAKEPKLLLNGKRWEVENQKNATGLTIDGDVKQTIYMGRCEGAVLTVKGKVNAITLDGCKKSCIVFDSCLSGVELINCKSCKVQVTDIVHTVTVDTCAGTQIILNRASLGADIVSAKSSELNIVVPGESEGDEFKEFAIPEQFVSKWDGTKWTTECMVHSV